MPALTPAQIQYFREHASDNRRPNIIATAVCSIFIGISAVLARFVGRRFARLQCKADDWLILAALLPLILMSAILWLGTRYGAGKHVIFVSDFKALTICLTIGQLAYGFSSMLIKFSILYFYCRIFQDKTLKIVSYGIAAFVAAYNVTYFLVIGFQCIPFSTLWTQKPGVCINTSTAYVVRVVINVLTDIIILTLPIRLVWNLQMKTVRKLQVCGIFALGGLVCVFAIVRIPAVSNIELNDASWSEVYGGIWAQAEIATGILAACLPTYGVFFRRKDHSSLPSRRTYPKSTDNPSDATENLALRRPQGNYQSRLNNDKASNSNDEQGARPSSRLDDEERGGY